MDNWINNRSRLTRLLVRARVADLQSIPQWIVYSDGLGNGLDSWTIQCEIVSHDFVGGGPPPQEPAPHHLDHLTPFDFFRLGQPGAGPVNAAVQQALQQPQAGLGHLGNNLGQPAQNEDQVQEEAKADLENNNGEDGNPNAQWDLLAA